MGNNMQTTTIQGLGFSSIPAPYRGLYGVMQDYTGLCGIISLSSIAMV